MNASRSFLYGLAVLLGDLTWRRLEHADATTGEVRVT